MRKTCVRELKPYSLIGIARILDVDVDRARMVIEHLMARGIVRYRDAGIADGMDASDGKDTISDELYQFSFVGMAMLGDIIIVSYPKYFRDRMPNDVELRQLFRVLRKDAGTASLSSMAKNGERSADRLPIMLTLLDLYTEYGVYSNYVEGRELNGGGVIDWNRTIGNHLPLLTDGEPIYAEYESRKTLRDEADFITRLHRAVLTECSRELETTGVADLLSIDGVWLSDEEVDSFGDTEMLGWRLERERGVQFVDWKVSVLELLERYLLDRESETEITEVKALGTISFYHLWEKACKVAFGDRLGMRLDALGIPLMGKWMVREHETLLDIIPRPKWERWNGKEFTDCGDVDTLIPDTVTFTGLKGGDKALCIYDAKYYVPSASGKMKGQPELESVTKQFLYQAAYRDFVLDHGFERVVNAFLVPSCDGGLRKMARVSFPEVMGTVELPFSNYVDMWALPAEDIFEAYLNSTEICDKRYEALWMMTSSKKE